MKVSNQLFGGQGKAPLFPACFFIQKKKSNSSIRRHPARWKLSASAKAPWVQATRPATPFPLLSSLALHGAGRCSAENGDAHRSPLGSIIPGLIIVSGTERILPPSPLPTTL